jgi:RNA polymerase sigma-70 factor (ECF subfamily)
MDKPDDTDLVRKTIDGDQTAFETLLVKYEKPVFNAAYRMLNNADDAHDVTQTVFLKAYEHLDQFDPKYRFFSWIYRIALNESVNRLKSRSRLDELTDEPATETGGPEYETSRAQESRTIQSALMAIKTEYRTVIVLKHFLDCNYLEISQILEIPEKKVKSRLYSGRQLLKESLQDMRQKR